MDKFLRLRTEENVVSSSKALIPGDETEGVLIQESISVVQKIATVRITQEAPMRKFGQIIGYAAHDIAAGAYIRMHDIEFRPTDGLY